MRRRRASLLPAISTSPNHLISATIPITRLRTYFDSGVSRLSPLSINPFPPLHCWTRAEDDRSISVLDCWRSFNPSTLRVTERVTQSNEIKHTMLISKILIRLFWSFFSWNLQARPSASCQHLARFNYWKQISPFEIFFLVLNGLSTSLHHRKCSAGLEDGVVCCTLLFWCWSFKYFQSSNWLLVQLWRTELIFGFHQRLKALL